MELKHITKIYPGVTALDDVSIAFKEGEVHALVGENGAGKSTFIKTIAGAIHPTSGEICIDGVSYPHLEPAQALNLGVAVVYQEMVQMEAMTVMDNIFMGIDEGKSLFVNDRERAAKTRELLDRFRCNVSPRALIRELSMANRQIIEIAKAVVKNAKLVIMDEPTASITVEEQKRLFEIIRELKSQGVTIIYISHRLEELSEICDRVSVLRDGKYVTTVNMAETNKQHLISLMVGRELSESYPNKKSCNLEVVLRTENLCGNGLSDINITLHRGEILGFGGLVGAGRTELMHLLYGAAKKTSGHIYLGDTEVNFHSPADGLKAGIGLIPEDRKYQGCFLEKPLFWNISISNIDTLSHGGFVDTKAEMAQAEEYKGKMRIKAPTMTQQALSLSGGNQQKVVIAKAMAALPDILIFDEPTRGIDVGARAEIYQMMIDLTQQGKSILMVSSDMEELLGMSERIVVLYDGHQAGVLNKDEFSQETILTLASGL
ncbi:MAG: sugar ABC transporter ATP-binding protein [Oscillospiraceae bacterium]|nr:sugar ABC transporter ATP-binding protein [Oscillospiraceae bacterium]